MASDLNDLHLVELTEAGRTFKTGQPVEFSYLRNTEKAPNFGARFQQDVEPTGRYMVHNDNPGELLPRWETGTVQFRNPLVLAFNSEQPTAYDRFSWKARLSDHYGCTGAALTAALMRDGYDGIVTVTVHNDRPSYTAEIVQLRVPDRKTVTADEKISAAQNKEHQRTVDVYGTHILNLVSALGADLGRAKLANLERNTEPLRESVYSDILILQKTLRGMRRAIYNTALPTHGDGPADPQLEAMFDTLDYAISYFQNEFESDMADSLPRTVLTIQKVGLDRWLLLDRDFEDTHLPRKVIEQYGTFSKLFDAVQRRCLTQLRDPTVEPGSDPWEAVDVGRMRLVFLFGRAGFDTKDVTPERLWLTGPTARDLEQHDQELHAAIPHVVAAARRAHQLLQRHGFGKLWYGQCFVGNDLLLSSLMVWHRATTVYADTAGTYDPDFDKIDLYRSTNGRGVGAVLQMSESDLADLMVHEIGHRFWYKTLSSEQRAEFQQLMQDVRIGHVSEYAKTNTEEAFAELFMYIVGGGDVPQDWLDEFKRLLGPAVKIKGSAAQQSPVWRESVLAAGELLGRLKYQKQHNPDQLLGLLMFLQQAMRYDDGVYTALGLAIDDIKQDGVESVSFDAADFDNPRMIERYLTPLNRWYSWCGVIPAIAAAVKKTPNLYGALLRLYTPAMRSVGRAHTSTTGMSLVEWVEYVIKVDKKNWDAGNYEAAFNTALSHALRRGPSVAQHPGTEVMKLDNGWSVWELLTEQELIAEGQAMNNCLKDDQQYQSVELGGHRFCIGSAGSKEYDIGFRTCMQDIVERIDPSLLIRLYRRVFSIRDQEGRSIVSAAVHSYSYSTIEMVLRFNISPTARSQQAGLLPERGMIENAINSINKTQTAAVQYLKELDLKWRRRVTSGMVLAAGELLLRIRYVYDHFPAEVAFTVLKITMIGIDKFPALNSRLGNEDIKPDTFSAELNRFAAWGKYLALFADWIKQDGNKVTPGSVASRLFALARSSKLDIVAALLERMQKKPSGQAAKDLLDDAADIESIDQLKKKPPAGQQVAQLSNGWTVVQLFTQEELEQEGRVWMMNCIGDNYITLSSGAIVYTLDSDSAITYDIFSLRDPLGIPRIDVALHSYDHTVSDAREFGNREVSRHSEAYQTATREFFDVKYFKPFGNSKSIYIEINTSDLRKHMNWPDIDSGQVQFDIPEVGMRKIVNLTDMFSNTVDTASRYGDITADTYIEDGLFVVSSDGKLLTKTEWEALTEAFHTAQLITARKRYRDYERRILKYHLGTAVPGVAVVSVFENETRLYLQSEIMGHIAANTDKTYGPDARIPVQQFLEENFLQAVPRIQAPDPAEAVPSHYLTEGNELQYRFSQTGQEVADKYGFEMFMPF